MDKRTDVVSQTIEEDQSEGVFDVPIIGGTVEVTEEALDYPFTSTAEDESKGVPGDLPTDTAEVESKELPGGLLTDTVEVESEELPGPKCPPCLCSDATTQLSYWTHSHLSVIEVYL